LKTLQQLSEESLRGFGVPAWLNEDVEHDAVLIHGAPKIMSHALDPNEHLVEVLFVPRPRTASSRPAGKALAEFLAPAPDGLTGDDDATLGQQQLNIS
jgi:hypothetical protein